MQPQNLPQQSLTEHDTTTHADTLSGGGMLLRSWSPSLWVQTHLIQKYRSGLCGNRHNTERLELCRLCLLTMPTEPPSFCRGYGLGLRIQALQMKRPDHMWRKMTSRSVLYIYIYMFAIMFALSIIQYQLTGVTYHARKQIYLCLLMSHRRKYIESSININIQILF